MKKKLLIPSIIVLLTAFAVAGVFLLMQLYIADKSFDTLDRALKSLIDLQASAAYNGYFAWTKMYDLVMQGNLTEANALADEIPKSFPLVASAEIMQGVPPEENFVVGADGELLRIVYSIRDDDEFRTAPNAVAVTIIQASKLLDIVSPNGFKIDMTGGRKNHVWYSCFGKFDAHKPMEYHCDGSPHHTFRVASYPAICKENSLLS